MGEQQVRPSDRLGTLIEVQTKPRSCQRELNQGEVPLGTGD